MNKNLILKTYNEVITYYRKEVFDYNTCLTNNITVLIFTFSTMPFTVGMTVILTMPKP